MNDCMIDLETLSTRSNAVILTIGAIKFDRHGDIRKEFPAYPNSAQEIMNTVPGFYARIDIASCRALKMHVDTGTLKWWDRQKPEAKYEAFSKENRQPIIAMLDHLYLWFGSTKNPWSHGSGFDCAILDEYYAATNKKSPWHFAEARDTRTLFDLANLTRNDQKALRGPAHHHALFDAYDQIIQTQECFRRLGVKNG